jgi:hypothetical protein
MGVYGRCSDEYEGKMLSPWQAPAQIQSPFPIRKVVPFSYLASANAEIRSGQKFNQICRSLYRGRPHRGSVTGLALAGVGSAATSSAARCPLPDLVSNIVWLWDPGHVVAPGFFEVSRKYANGSKRQI